MRLLPIAAMLLFATASARAQSLRDLCTTRPSLGTSACVVDKGHVVVELGVADWERDDAAGMRTDTLLGGDLLVRYGVTQDAELQVGWTAVGRVRETDRTTRMRRSRSGVGDVMVAWRQNLASADGSGTSYGVQPFVTAPVGRQPVGAGDWGAGIVVPISFALGENVQLVFDPEADAAVDEDGAGRHLAYGGVAGVEIGLSDAVATTIELSAFRDRDPMGHVTEALAALSLTWQPRENVQLDVAGIAGLNHDSADVRVLTGVSTRF